MAPPKSARTEGPKRTETTPNPSLNPDTTKPYDGLEANKGLYGPERAEGPKRAEATPNPSLNPNTAKPYEGLQANKGLYGP